MELVVWRSRCASVPACQRAVPRVTPFGPYGGLCWDFLRRDPQRCTSDAREQHAWRARCALCVREERQEETPERLEPLGAASGAADIEYEQFMKAKEAR